MFFVNIYLASHFLICTFLSRPTRERPRLNDLSSIKALEIRSLDMQFIRKIRNIQKRRGNYLSFFGCYNIRKNLKVPGALTFLCMLVVCRFPCVRCRRNQSQKKILPLVHFLRGHMRPKYIILHRAITCSSELSCKENIQLFQSESQNVNLCLCMVCQLNDLWLHHLLK